MTLWLPKYPRFPWSWLLMVEICLSNMWVLIPFCYWWTTLGWPAGKCHDMCSWCRPFPQWWNVALAWVSQISQGTSLASLSPSCDHFWPQIGRGERPVSLDTSTVQMIEETSLAGPSGGGFQEGLSEMHGGTSLNLLNLWSMKAILEHHTSGQLKMAKKCDGFQGCHENALTQSIEMSPHLIVWRSHT